MAGDSVSTTATTIADASLLNACYEDMLMEHGHWPISEQLNMN